MSNWPPSLPPYRPENGHSTKELEHRFTALEANADRSRDDRSDLHKIVAKHSDKLTFHERVILALAIAVGTMVQDKLPALASILKTVVAGR